MKRKIWFDTEFMDDGITIELISIGMVRDDGVEYYAESAEADLSKANDWVKENVLNHLTGIKTPRAPRKSGHSVALRLTSTRGLVRMIGSVCASFTVVC